MTTSYPHTASFSHSEPPALTFCADQPWVAPLAGYSDLPFRLLCRDFGGHVACTEMVSAKGLVYKSNGTHTLLNTTAQDSHEHPLVVQLFGNEVPFLQQALDMLLAQGFSYFDLNMGCSVPKVNRTGCGSAMLKDVAQALHVAEGMIKHVTNAGPHLRMGFKIRLGWTEDAHVWQELAQGLEALGAHWITLHPRTAKQGFGGQAAWEHLTTLKSLVRIPVIASGDLFTAEDGVRCLRETGVDTVMYARGAMQNPAVFEEHTCLCQGGNLEMPTPEKLMRLIGRHMQLAQLYSNERVALLKMRTFVPRYVHHFPGVKRLRQEMASCANFQDLDLLLQEFFNYANKGII